MTPRVTASLLTAAVVLTACAGGASEEEREVAGAASASSSPSPSPSETETPEPADEAAEGLPANRTVTPSELTVGMCLILPASDVVANFSAIDCDLEHDLEVIEISDLDTGSDRYPGRENLQESAYLVCEGPAFTNYVGAEYQASTIYVESMVPTPEAWAAGNREVYCMGYVPDDRLIGSIRGIGR